MNLKQRYKRHLFEKQGGLCYWCGRPMQMHTLWRKGKRRYRRDFATFEHLHRRSNGNRNDAKVLAHYRCNIKANAAYIAMFGNLYNRYLEVRKRFNSLVV